MKITLLFLGALVLAASASAQTPAAPTPPEFEAALAAAPAQLRAGATIIKWKPDFTYEVVRKGTNRLVCMETSGLPGQQPFSSECSSIANLERITQNLKFEAETDRAKRTAAIAAAEKAGTRAKPEMGSVWYSLRGPSREQARGHMTVAVPGATAQSLGIPDNGKQDGVWIMDAGTSAAHLMVPGH
jgi:hypothetical protein